MASAPITFEGELWEYEGEAAWVFVTLPEDKADKIKARLTKRKPFGSVKVRVRTDDVEWETSLFPEGQRDTYVLPVKKQVRHQARIDIGDTALFSVEPITQ